MSYLTELNALVTRRQQADSARGTTEEEQRKMFKQVATSLLQCAIWLYYDEYNEITAYCVACSGEFVGTQPLARIDIRETPVVTVKSSSFVAMVRDICSTNREWHIERKELKALLAARSSKATLLARMKPVAEKLGKHIRAKRVDDGFRQHRCFVFPLEALVRLAGLDMTDLMPDKSQFKLMEK